jgi:hypothetical protein
MKNVQPGAPEDGFTTAARTQLVCVWTGTESVSRAPFVAALASFHAAVTMTRARLKEVLGIDYRVGDKCPGISTLLETWLIFPHLGQPQTIGAMLHCGPPYWLGAAQTTMFLV